MMAAAARAVSFMLMPCPETTGIGLAVVMMLRLGVERFLSCLG